MKGFYEPGRINGHFPTHYFPGERRFDAFKKILKISKQETKKGL